MSFKLKPRMLLLYFYIFGSGFIDLLFIKLFIDLDTHEVFLSLSSSSKIFLKKSRLFNSEIVVLLSSFTSKHLRMTYLI